MVIETSAIKPGNAVLMYRDATGETKVISGAVVNMDAVYTGVSKRDYVNPSSTDAFSGVIDIKLTLSKDP